MSAINWILLVAMLISIRIIWIFGRHYLNAKRAIERAEQTAASSTESHDMQPAQPAQQPAQTGDVRPAGSKPPATKRPLPQQSSLDIGQNMPARTRTAAEFEDGYIAINVVCREGDLMAGTKLLRLASDAALKLSEDGIFCKYNAAGVIDFSMANAVEPGTFELANIDAMQIHGVSLFLQFKQTDNQMAAFDNMQSFATKIARHFHATLKDEQHNSMTEEDFKACRQRAAQCYLSSRLQPANEP